MHVLLADDQAAVRLSLRLVLEGKLGLSVIAEASDGDELLSKALGFKPNMILLDWELPGQPAAELAQQLRGHLQDLRLVAMSSLPEAQRSALRAGADAFVDKGGGPAEMLLTIGKLVSEAAVTRPEDVSKTNGISRAPDPSAHLPGEKPSLQPTPPATGRSCGPAALPPGTAPA